MSSSIPQGYFIEDLQPGMSASYSRIVTDADVTQFSEVSGDKNPIHLDDEFAKSTPFGERIAHGMLTASFFSTVLGTKMPGSGSIYISQSLRFRAPVKIGDEVTASVTVSEVNQARRRVHLTCACHVGDTVVVDGEATLMVPSRQTKA